MGFFRKISLKKRLSLILATVFALGTIMSAVPAFAVSTYDSIPEEVGTSDAFLPSVTMPTDVTSTASSWAYTDIVDMLALGAVKGYPNKMFYPKKSVTRAEFATMLERVLNLPSSEEEVELKDVSASHWAMKSIAKALPYLPLYHDGSFRPNAAATREDIAAALVLATGLDKKVVDVTSVDLIFEDYKTVSPELKNLIAIAVDQKLIKGYSYSGSNSFYSYQIKAQNFVTRAEVCNMLNNARNKVTLGYKVAPATGDEE